MRKTLAAISLCLCAAWSHADTIVTKTNDVIHGTILRLRSEKVVIETAFAGTLRIPRDQVKSMDFDDANREKSFFARTDVENKAKEEVRLGRDAEGNLVFIPVADKAKALAVSDVQTLWATDAEDPDFPPIKRWAFSLAFGLNGNSGNTQDLSVSTRFEAIRTTETTTLKLYASYDKTRSFDTLTAEQYIGGLDLEYRPNDIASWYLRDEAQHNRFSDYHLRNVFAAGYGHYLINRSVKGRTTTLRFRLGLSHSYTRHYSKSFPGSDSRLVESDLGLDLGFLFHHDFACGLGWNTEITYIPLIDDFAEGTLVHETNLTYTLRELRRFHKRLSDIALEAGMRNEYKTDPDPQYCNTDTTWYFRMKKTW